jgi:uncharacterized membrane protein YoaK (UPF0700 family)
MPRLDGALPGDGPDPPEDAENAALALILAGVAGATDAVGYLTLFGLFTAHMTGNTVAMAAHVGQEAWREALRRGFPIPAFVLGATAGALLGMLARRWGRRYALAFLGQAMVLVLAMALGGRRYLGTEPHLTPAYFLVGGLLAFAMGMQAATLRRVGHWAVRTPFVTGMLASVGMELAAAAADASNRARAATKAAFLVALWAAYAGAAVLATLLERGAGFLALALPLAGLVAAEALELARPSDPVP